MIEDNPPLEGHYLIIDEGTSRNKGPEEKKNTITDFCSIQSSSTETVPLSIHEYNTLKKRPKAAEQPKVFPESSKNLWKDDCS